MSFFISTLLVVLIYLACGVAAGVVQRALGLLSVAHAVVLGCGAYAYAITTTMLELSLFAGLVVAILLSSVVGLLLTLLAVRVRDERYALVTFGVQVIWLGLATNLTSITGGVLGISGISVPGNESYLLMFVFATVVIATLFFSNFINTPLGAGGAVIEKSIELAMSLGVRYLLILSGVGFVYGGVIGLSGVILAAHVTFIDPTLFAVGTSVTVLSIAFFVVAKGVVGGFLGAVVLVGVPQFARLFGISSSEAGYFQLILSGVCLVIATILFLNGKKIENF